MDKKRGKINGIIRCIAVMLIISLVISFSRAEKVRADDDKVKTENTTTDVKTDDNESDTPRFSTKSNKRLFSTGETVIWFKYKNRTDEELKVSISKKKTASVSVGNWINDDIAITLVPKKDKTVYLTVTCGDETIKLKMYLRKEEERTPESIYSNFSKAMVEIKSTEKNQVYTGSGFFISDRVLVTNYHVIEYALNLKISGYDGKEYHADEVYAIDEINDVAILGVVEKNECAFDLYYDEAVTGETVYTMGSPLKYTGTFTEGIVSLNVRILDEIKYIQVTNPVSTGSGGGPLINTKGEVIGITTLTVPAAQNVNFALPSSYIKQQKTDEIFPITYLYDENSYKDREESGLTVFFE